MGWGVEVVRQGMARTRCGSKKLWLNKFVLLIRRTLDPAPPSNKENLYDWVLCNIVRQSNAQASRMSRNPLV